MRAQTQLSEIDALSDQGHAWLAQNWGTAPLPVLEDQLGPMAAAAIVWHTGSEK